MTESIRFAVNPDGQSVAYQVLGDGALDILFIPDWVSNLEVFREEPTIARFCDRLASIGRLILMDKRGSGLSDSLHQGAIPTPEEWVNDAVTVLDDLGSDRVVVFGHGEGGAMSTLFAATYPSRCEALILVDSCARRLRDEDYPQGLPPAMAQALIDWVVGQWGTGEAITQGAPSLAHSRVAKETRARLERLAMSPGQFAELYPPTLNIDFRAVLPTLSVPALVMHREGNRYMRADGGRYLADHIPQAEWVELSGDDHFFHAGDFITMLETAQHFLTGTREAPDLDRVLATVLFTDIVGSTDLAAQIGDRAWHDLLDQHHALVRRELKRFRGVEVDTAGDGFFATFDGPARGVRCALALREVLAPLGIQLRAGLHTGEVELMGDKVGGIAVHIGARICSLAAPGEVAVSRTVTDLVAGSGLLFERLGDHELKGVEGRWPLFRAT